MDYCKLEAVVTSNTHLFLVSNIMEITNSIQSASGKYPAVTGLDGVG